MSLVVGSGHQPMGYETDLAIGYIVLRKLPLLTYPEGSW